MSDPLSTARPRALGDLLLAPDQASLRRREAASWPSWDLTPSQLADLELMLSGAYAPLRGFMTAADAAQCAAEGRLTDGTPWPRPVTLEVVDPLASQLTAGARLVLRDPEGVPLAVLHVSAVAPAANAGSGVIVGGDVEGLQRPVHHDFAALRLTPSAVRSAIASRGWRRAVAVFVPGLLHVPLAERALTAARAADAGLVIVALLPPARHGDADHFPRVRAIRAAVAAWPRDQALLMLLPWNTAAASREARHRAIVARNLGCTHVATPGSAETPAAEADVVPIAIEVDPAVDVDLADALRGGAPLPPTLLLPAVADELRRWHRPATRRGFTVFFTGLSGSGKSTLANLLRVRLLERDARRVSLLDGDLVRKHLSSELGFSREHRELNVRRIAYVASEITAHGGVAICAPIAPFDGVRREARRMIEAVGEFVLVYISTPLEICEARDVKGLYAKARAGIIPAFTGVSDPYEAPADADLDLETSTLSPEAAVDRVLTLLERRGLIEPDDGRG